MNKLNEFILNNRFRIKFHYLVFNIYKYIFIIFFIKHLIDKKGIGDWGLGIGDWGLGTIPHPTSPIPNPQHSMFKINLIIKFF